MIDIVVVFRLNSAIGLAGLIMQKTDDHSNYKLQLKMQIFAIYDWFKNSKMCVLLYTQTVYHGIECNLVAAAGRLPCPQLSKK